MADRQWKDKKPARSLSAGHKLSDEKHEGQDVARRVLPTTLRRSQSEYLGQEEKYLYEEKQELVSFKNVAGYEEWVSGIVNQRPPGSLKEAPFNWFRTVGEVAKKIYRTPKQALQEGDFIPCYNPLGSGSYGDVVLGFHRQDMKKPVPQRRAVAIKRSTMRLTKPKPTPAVLSLGSIYTSHQSAGSDQPPDSFTVPSPSPDMQWSAPGSPSEGPVFSPPSGFPSFRISSGSPGSGSSRGAVGGSWKDLSTPGSSNTSSPFGDLACEKTVIIETACLLVFRHRNIVRMIDRYAIQKSEIVCQVLEYCDGGTLYNAIQESKDGRMQEEEARYYFKQLVDGLVYINDMSVVHRDLKPENCLLQISPDGRDMILKICDFGLSTVFEYKNSYGQLVELEGDARTGTIPYVPPEGLHWLFAPQELLGAFLFPRDIPTDPLDIQHFGKPFEQPNPSQRKDLSEIGLKAKYFKLPPLDVYASGVILYQMLVGIEKYPYNVWNWPIGLDLVFRGEAIRCKYLISDETFAFFKLLTNPDTVIRPPIQYVQGCHWMRKPSRRPSRIQPSKFEDYRKTTAFLNCSQFKSEGQEFLGREHIARHQSESSHRNVSSSPSASRGSSMKSRSRRK